ncbi:MULTISPECIES: VOC family protein [unclassified Streptomyces]|uniref:VOC family protein n=1 Tax=unclassified Streptomyces TaxID=2593676 RepID=UPI0005F98C76|nr:MULTISPECIES: VOC family protein [unclassified Streptomyces]KJY33478.1 glyoxalase [Streptomyces sp. NRRL S-495]KOV30759.1 glyoxalase [Streptomyces sp. XY431]
MDWKLEVVVVPVADVDRAKTFYEEQAGFTVDHDTRIRDGLRVVQLTPPGSGCSIVLGTDLTDAPAGSVKGLQLVVPDIDRAYKELLARGVEVSPVQHFEAGNRVDGRGEVWNSFVFFNDPDGNAWAVQEAPGRR